MPPSGRDRIIRTRIMRKREVGRRSTKNFAQDRGSTELLRAHNASARTIGRGRKRILRRENFDKNAAGRRFCGSVAVKISEQHKFEKSVLLARIESQKVDSSLRGGEQSEPTRARGVADELKALALKALRRQERVFGYVSMSPTTSRMRSEREKGAYFSKHARRRGKKRCARQSPK